MRQGIEEGLHILKPYLDYIAVGLEIAAVAFVVYGAIISTVFLVKSEIKNPRKAGKEEHGILLQFTSRLVTSLQFLIAADIIKTISAPTFEHMLQLGFVVGIRTVIAIALNREMSKERHEMEKRRENREKKQEEKQQEEKE